MKKRILALLAAGTMLLTGCGAQNAAQSDAAKSGSDDLQHLTLHQHRLFCLSGIRP